jgi:hypothetical protein
MGGAGGGFTMMQMLFASEGAPLDLLLEDAGVVTECRIATIEPEGNLLPLDFGFKAVPSRNNIIMHSEPLKEALMEIQQLGERTARAATRHAAPAAPSSLFCMYLLAVVAATRLRRGGDQQEPPFPVVLHASSLRSLLSSLR